MRLSKEKANQFVSLLVNWVEAECNVSSECAFELCDDKRLDRLGKEADEKLEEFNKELVKLIGWETGQDKNGGYELKEIEG